jgi:hypothetical protein
MGIRVRDVDVDVDVEVSTVKEDSLGDLTEPELEPSQTKTFIQGSTSIASAIAEAKEEIGVSAHLRGIVPHHHISHTSRHGVPSPLGYWRRSLICKSSDQVILYQSGRNPDAFPLPPPTDHQRHTVGTLFYYYGVGKANFPSQHEGVYSDAAEAVQKAALPTH